MNGTDFTLEDLRTIEEALNRWLDDSEFNGLPCDYDAEKLLVKVTEMLDV